MPAGFELVNRSLHRLGDRHMGMVRVFRNGRQQVHLYSGPDLFDQLDDLDLTSRELTVGRSRFLLWSSKVTPELLVAVLVDHTLVAPCDHIGILTRYVPPVRMHDFMRDLRVDRG